MKTINELQDELQILQNELAECNRVATDRATRSYLVQSAQTAVLLGNKTSSDLQQAQTSLDESIAAIVRKPMLEQAVADHRALIDDAQHRERSEFIASIKSEFIDVMDRYKVESKKLLDIHNALVALDNKYRSIAPAAALLGLLDPYFRELNLPAATGSLASRSGFTTGQEP